ncbi:MAG: nuclear transport factor 2 family protein [Pyrinomonadaceae bacterium]
MKKLLLLAVMLLTVGSVGAQNSKASKVLIEADQAWLKVFAAKDLASAEHCLEDGSVMAPNLPAANGKDGIRKLFSGFFALPDFKIKWTPNKISISGDMGVTSGVYEMSFGLPDNKTLNDTGKYVTVWKKDGSGKWKVWLDIFNSDKPA